MSVTISPTPLPLPSLTSPHVVHKHGSNRLDVLISVEVNSFYSSSQCSPLPNQGEHLLSLVCSVCVREVRMTWSICLTFYFLYPSPLSPSKFLLDFIKIMEYKSRWWSTLVVFSFFYFHCPWPRFTVGEDWVLFSPLIGQILIIVAMVTGFHIVLRGGERYLRVCPSFSQRWLLPWLPYTFTSFIYI